MSSDERGGGYGKPPKRSQFKKGKSGNPGGRPKGSSSFAAAIRAVGETIVSTKADGTPVSAWDSLAQNFLVLASKNVKGMELLLNYELQREKLKGQQTKAEGQYTDAEIRRAVELLRNAKNGVLQVTVDFEEELPASFCGECQKKLDDIAAAYQRDERPTEH